MPEQQPEPCSRGIVTLPISLGKIIPYLGSPTSLPYKSRHSVWFQWKQLWEKDGFSLSICFNISSFVPMNV